MSDLRDLYQEVILDHYRKPRNFRSLADANRKAEGFNPLCGDRLTLYVKLKDGVIADASFEGSGCAISTASASLLTESIKGKTEHEAEMLFQGFRDVVTGSGGTPNVDLGKLPARRLAEYRATKLGYVDQHYGRALAPELTAREWQIFELMHSELSTPQIAKRLVLSPITVRSHARSIRNKLERRTAVHH